MIMNDVLLKYMINELFILSLTLVSKYEILINNKQTTLLVIFY